MDYHGCYGGSSHTDFSPVSIFLLLPLQLQISLSAKAVTTMTFFSPTYLLGFAWQLKPVCGISSFRVSYALISWSALCLLLKLWAVGRSPWVRAGESPEELAIHHHAAKQTSELVFTNVASKIRFIKHCSVFFLLPHHFKDQGKHPASRTKTCARVEFPPCFFLSYPTSQNLKTSPTMKKHLIFPLTITFVSGNVLLHSNTPFTVCNSPLKTILANFLSLLFPWHHKGRLCSGHPFPGDSPL